jgi:aspartate racemase
MKKLGVLGGMGPAASSNFMVRLTYHTVASCDQEHIPTILWSDPRIPDRSTSMRNNDNLPLPFLKLGISGLQQAGCDYIVIPCNTAHFWYHDLVTLGTPIIHIVDSVIDQLLELKVSQSALIGIIGTQATIEFGLYTTIFNQQGWDCITPTKKEMDSLVTPAINLIKGNKINEAHPLLLEVVHSLISRGAQSVILGCTEIPLAITETNISNVPIVNSIDSLVKSAIKYATD